MTGSICNDQGLRTTWYLVGYFFCLGVYCPYIVSLVILGVGVKYWEYSECL